MSQSQMNESYLDNLFDVLQAEKNALVLDLKNDKELTKEKEITAKCLVLDNLIKNDLKYRNLKIKAKLKVEQY
jgi:hypothetical protein